MKHNFRLFISAALLLAVFFSLISCGAEVQPSDIPETLPYVNELFCELTRQEGSADFLMFRVGHSDAMLIATENCNILIDTGEKNDQDADKLSISIGLLFFRHCKLTFHGRLAPVLSYF